ncbi:MAG: TonB-dependent receptor [Acidobacteriota bacterium]
MVCPSFSQTVSGIITDSNGSAVTNAAVTIRSGEKTLARTVSNARGEFSLPVSTSSAIFVRVSAAGFALFEKSLDELPRPISIVLRPRQLREDVTVAIAGTETRLGETPASIVALDRRAIETTGAQGIDDALRQVAGFTLFRRSSSRTSNPTTQGANLRGIGGSGAARTAVQFDGVSLNDAFGGWTYWSRVPMIAVDQVEVLRGGASSLYGSSALSGAINIRGSNERAALRIETSGGAQNTFSGSVYSAFAVRKWAFALTSESFRTAGYIPIAPGERGAIDTRVNSRHNTWLLTFEHRFNEAFRVFVRGNLFTERRDNGTRLTNNHTYFRQAVLGADYSSTNAGTFQFRTSIEAQIYDQTFTSVGAGRNTEDLTRIQRVPSRSASLNAYWSRPFSFHTLLASVEVRDVRGFSDEIAVANGPATAVFSAGGRELKFGLLAQDSWLVSKKLILNFGLRLDRWRNSDASSRTQSLTGGQSTVTLFPDRDLQRLSGRVSTLYQLGKGISLFAAYNSSFRSPSLNELYRAFRVGNALTLANENLKAETADTFETGASFTGIKRRLSIRGNFYLTEVSDPVVSVTLSTTPSPITRQRQNVGRSRSRGFEFDAEFVPVPRLRLSASYLLVESRISSFPTNLGLVGKWLPQIPHQQFTFQAAYMPNSKITLSLQGRVSGGQFDDDLNTFRLRPFFSADAFASYRFPCRFEIFAAGENLTDSRFDIGLTPNRTIAAPRSVRVGIRFDLKRCRK